MKSVPVKKATSKAASVTLQPAAVRRIAGRYPFGHSGDIADADAGIAPGEVVDVKAPGGQFVARGYFNPEGATPLRLLTWEREDIDLKFYRARVRSALKRRAGRILNTDALRVLHAEADGMPGVVADQFGAVLAVQLRNAGVERHRDLILKALREETGAACAYERSDTGERRREGLELKTGPLWGDLPERVTFHEDDLTLHFAPMEAQKTGFFLDQRDNRRLMRSLVTPGMGFLDVYSYTGGFSLHAARAGANSVAVDKDQTALAALEGAARTNGVQVGVRWGDALDVLAALEREKRSFGAAVLDPPTLAKRRDDVPRAKRIFTQGAAHALRMLTPEGHLLISTCAHYIRVDDLLDAARVAAAEADCDAEVVDVTYQPADHPHLLSVPESLYLKSILLRKQG
ncbi:methyltransferase [Deinococcus aerophilus]|uniref:Methyltransferase n=1 Tax=Deinococcus aerophilus TaxID=522488 RepID=A0ABQ2GQI9_9DEIO|nr:methyltransferase [Deinococcus aerophilus]